MIEYDMRAVCDSCKAVFERSENVKVTQIEWVRSRWRREWKRTGAMQGLPNRFGKYKLYCPACAGK